MSPQIDDEPRGIFYDNWGYDWPLYRDIFVYAMENGIPMAVHALAYLKAHPERVMVLLAGTGHVRKQAVPAQIKARADIPVTIILPETAGVIDGNTITPADADYLILE